MGDRCQSSDVSCLLKLRLVPKQLLTHRSTGDNARASPFLRLPPETRNRIYEYVLGGNTIHVMVQSNGEPHSYRLVHSLCKDTHDDTFDDDYLRCQQHIIEPRGAPWSWLSAGYQERHEANGCSEMKAVIHHDRLNLALLQTCRQLHREAARVPFFSNNFSVPTSHAAGVFINKLLTQQQRAIRSLVFLSQHDDVYITLGKFFKQLPNLKRLEVEGRP